MIHLLIVSHNSLCSKAIALVLQSPQVEIQRIDSSACIIEACRQRRIDLIIFLTLTPYFTAMNIIEEMASELNYRPTIYVISHSHSQTTILMLLECGVDQYMTFPLNLYRLREKVYSLLETTI